MSNNVLRCAAGLLLALPTVFAVADAANTVNEQCAACHAVEHPDYEGLGIDERMQRKAPPLYFAGNKYRQEWLEAWLQAPQTIHPAGYFPETAVTTSADGDIPDAAALHEHQTLDAANAKQVAEFLMTLRPHDDLIGEDSYTPGSVSPRMGKMDFRKFKGCNACHQDEPGEGGLSGPVVYNAWGRLQPAFISSYVQDPTAWDPNSTMPVSQMNEAAVHKLVHYLRAIGGEE